MWANNTRLASCLVLATVAGLAAADQTWIKKDPKALLSKSMRQARQLNVIAIIVKSGDRGAVAQQVKVEQLARGVQVGTVLAPLSMQGVTFVDDGRRSVMYLPDQRLLLECQALSDFADDVSFRMELASRNYNLHLENAERIAGRPTFKVVASPKEEGLPARQFYMDQQNLYPLRMATEEANGQWKVYRDTQVVQYPRQMAPPSYNINPPGTTQKIRYAPAKPLNSVSNVTSRLGFQPVIPSNLPFGFKVQRSELRSNEGGQLAVLRLTDGLASAWVYEYRCNEMREGIWSQGNSTVLTEDGVTIQMISDLDESVRRKILGSFATRRPSRISPPSQGTTVILGVKGGGSRSKEPNTPKEMFSNDGPGPVKEPKPAKPCPAAPLPDVTIGKGVKDKGDQ